MFNRDTRRLFQPPEYPRRETKRCHRPLSSAGCDRKRGDVHVAT